MMSVKEAFFLSVSVNRKNAVIIFSFQRLKFSMSILRFYDNKFAFLAIS